MMAPQYVRNELLAYVFDQKDRDHEFDIDRTVSKFYNDDAIKNAKSVLWEHYAAQLPAWQERKKGAQPPKEKNIRDILSGAKTIDEKCSAMEDLPVIFAAVKLCNVPSERFARECDVNERIINLEVQMKLMMEDRQKRHSFAAVASPPPNVAHNVDRAAPTPYQPANIMQPLQRDALNAGRDKSVSDNRSRDQSRNRDTRDNRHNRGTRDFRDDRNIGDTRDNVDWFTAHKRRRRRPNAVYGKSDDDVISKGQRRQELFVFRVNKTVTDEQISEYIKKKENIDLISLKCVSHADAASNSYHVTVHCMDTKLAMAPEFWPVGVGCRVYLRSRRPGVQDFTPR